MFPAFVFPVAALVPNEFVCEITEPSAVFILMVKAFISESLLVIFKVFVSIKVVLLLILDSFVFDFD
uniref:Uncharacterized protein n=1 Tax=viral metagenome TaxID=1070528 RepID=A0A6C0ITA8_9ZZZZ